MPDPKKRQSKEVLQNWIETCQDNIERLSKWEQGFIDSIAQQFECNGSLSELQEATLEKIYAEKTP